MRLQNITRKIPPLFPSPSDGREYISPASSNFKSLQQKREYSYTMWMYVDNMDYNFNKYKHVFTRGNATDFKSVNAQGSVEQIAVPGIWIDKIKNNLIFKMSKESLTKMISLQMAFQHQVHQFQIG